MLDSFYKNPAGKLSVRANYPEEVPDSKCYRVLSTASSLMVYGVV